jgi:hypothetical protein
MPRFGPGRKLIKVARFTVEFEVFRDPKDPLRLCLVSDDGRLTGPTGGPGMPMAVSANRRSVDENEHNFNRLARAMAAEATRHLHLSPRLAGGSWPKRGVTPPP